MSTERSHYGWIDHAALTAGLGLVILGLAVLGVLETLLGSAHFTQDIVGIGVITVHTSFNPELRASIIALGLLILLVWGTSRVGRALLASEATV